MGVLLIPGVALVFVAAFLTGAVWHGFVLKTLLIWFAPFPVDLGLLQLGGLLVTIRWVVKPPSLSKDDDRDLADVIWDGVTSLMKGVAASFVLLLMAGCLRLLLVAVNHFWG